MINDAVNCGNRYALLKDNKYKDEDINEKFIDEYIRWCSLSNELCKKMNSKLVSKEDYKEAKEMCKIISRALDNAQSLKDLKKLSFKFKTKIDFNKEYRARKSVRKSRVRKSVRKSRVRKSRVRKSVRKSRVRKSRVRKSVRKSVVKKRY